MQQGFKLCVPLTTNSAPVDAACLSVAVISIFLSHIDVNNFQTPICPLQICSLSFSTFSLIIRKLMNLTDNKQRAPFIMIFFMNIERKMDERKIDTKTRSIDGPEFVVRRNFW